MLQVHVRLYRQARGLQGAGHAVTASRPPDLHRSTGACCTPGTMKRSRSEAFELAPPGADEAEFRAVCAALCDLHGKPSRHKAEGCELHTRSVLDSLVRTILSQNTTDITSARAFKSLKLRFPTWEGVRQAPPAEVAAAIKVGGLADIKAQRIQAILSHLHHTRGACCLEHLRTLPEEAIKQQLSTFKGVGPKTIACVLLFCLGRQEFPVDTHVWEMSRQLGWVPKGASREVTYQLLNGPGGVPPDIKYDLHVLMVQHGKVCAACGKRPAPKSRRPAAAADAAPAAGSPSPKGSVNTTEASPTAQAVTDRSSRSAIPTTRLQLCPLQPFKKPYRAAGSSSQAGIRQLQHK